MKNNQTWHTKLNFDECFAKVVLEEYYSEIYGDLQLRDKPDLWDMKNDIGIEVVCAVDEKMNEALMLWAKMPEKTHKQQEGEKKRMLDLGVEYQEGIMSLSSVLYPYDLQKSPLLKVIEVVGNKVDKLNNNLYAKCSRYDLFVVSSIYIQDELLSGLFERIKGVNNKEKTYSAIYLYGQKKIVEFDFILNRYTTKKDNKQNDLASIAIKMVEQGKNE